MPDALHACMLAAMHVRTDVLTEKLSILPGKSSATYRERAYDDSVDSAVIA